MGNDSQYPAPVLGELMDPSYAINSLFSFPYPDDYRRLGILLEDIGYTDTNIMKVL